MPLDASVGRDLEDRRTHSLRLESLYEDPVEKRDEGLDVLEGSGLKERKEGKMRGRKRMVSFDGFLPSISPSRLLPPRRALTMVERRRGQGRV